MVNDAAVGKPNQLLDDTWLCKKKREWTKVSKIFKK